MIDTWRTTPRLNGKSDNANASIKQHVMPSGRLAIVAALQHFGLSRPNRVALPEFSSHCVISSVGTFATPIPMREALETFKKPTAMLIYEQWGWPHRPASLERVFDIADFYLLDCVDSPDALDRHGEAIETDNCATIVSLSKCLGLAAGGVIQAKDFSNQHYLQNDSGAQQRDQKLLETDPTLYKIHAKTLCLIEQYLIEGDIKLSLANEVHDRKNNLTALSKSPLSFSWPKHMLQRVESGCAAGIAPLFKGMDPEKLRKASETLKQDFGIIAPIYNFNWSLDPVETDYQPCLAMPSHGEIKFSELLPSLEQSFGY